MGQIEDHLRRWLDAGVLESTSAERIRAFEGARRQEGAGESRPGALEALLYLGLAVLGGGVFALFAQQWEAMESWARVAAIGVPTLLMFGLGALLRFNDEPELQRGSQAAWFLTVGLFAGLLGVVFNEFNLGFAEQDERGPFLLIASATFVLAVALWVFSPAHAQVLAIAGSAFFLGQAVGNWPDEYSQALAGMTVFGIGVAGILLVEASWFSPALSARLFFSALVIVGPIEAGAGEGNISFEFVSAVAAAGVIAYGVFRASFLVMLTGVAGAFIILVTFIFEHFEERIGAPMAMMISGGILVAVVLLLAVYRRASQERRASA